MNSDHKCILIVDDDGALCSALTVRLQSEGYNVDTAGDGNEGVGKATSRIYDLIILDLMLPERNGWDVFRDIRHAGISTPILFLTGRRQSVDKVTGLRLGADDYITKPFNSAELMARVEVQLRRQHPARRPQGVHQFGPFEVDIERALVTRDGKPVHLARREFQLLRYLIERADNSISRAELLQAVWGYATTATRTIDVHIANLREKLESNPKHPALILTVGGIGYKAVSSKCN